MRIRTLLLLLSNSEVPCHVTMICDDYQTMLSRTKQWPLANEKSAVITHAASAMSTRRSCGTNRYINGVNVKHPPIRPHKGNNAPSSARERRSSHITRPVAQFIPEMSRSSTGRLHPEQRHPFRARYPKHACPRFRAVDSRMDDQ